MHRKLQRYNTENDIALFKKDQTDKTVKFPTIKFFQDNLTEIFEFLIRDNKYEMFESFRIYIERNGRPNNYLESNKKLNEEREAVLLAEEKEENARKEKEAKKEEIGDEKDQSIKEAETKKRMEKVAEHMKELETCCDLNMRQFLMKFIIPVLTEGMIDVWRYQPLDPVDYLADYMCKKSANMN